MNAIQDLLIPIANHQPLSLEEAQHAFQIILSGGATPAQISAFLMGLRVRGETHEEITAGAQVLRAKASSFAHFPGTLDCCGTGGDMQGTFNISTATAFVVAGCGVPVVKHGNRSVSSQSGSADVLEALGVKIDASAEAMERALREHNIAFLMATKYHSAMRHVAPIRHELGLRTVFNLLGPLVNPAQPEFQLVGVYDRKWLQPIAQTLHALGAKRAWVVHGAGGLDELSTLGKTEIVELRDGHLRSFSLSPEDAGLAVAELESLQGGNAEMNAKALRDVLHGVRGAYLDAVLLNAAACLVIAGKSDSLRDAAAIALNAIDEGKALRALYGLVEKSNG